MKQIYNLLIILLLNSSFAIGQTDRPGVVGGGQTSKGTYPTFQNGNATLGQMYNKTACGLDYTTASKKLGQRFHVAAGSSCVPFDGVAQPATLPISGIPTCRVIDKAYLWCSTSGNGAAITATLQNPLGASANFPMTLVGSDYDKGWGATGSYTYRADVTAAITGNGNYIVSNLPTFSNYPVTGNDVDGVTLFIIYRDLNATYSATLIIDDGCMVGDSIKHTVSGFNACATSNGEGFMIVADMQDVNCSNVKANEITIGGLTFFATQEDWWNPLTEAMTITAGQSSMFFSINNFWTGDLYNFLVAGVYYQNTTCTVCTPALISVGSSFTAANCGLNDGTATVTPSGGSGNYTYSWNTIPVQTSQTATGLAAGTYTATITYGSGCTTTKSVTVTGSTATTIGVSPSASIICNGSSVLLTASGGTAYTWNPTSGLSAGSGAKVTANPTTTTTYTVTGTNGGGCSGTTTVTVTVNAKPTIGISPSSATLCNGQSISITASGASTYAWNPTSGLSASTGAKVNANPTSTTTYTVTGTNGNGCSNTAAITITVNAKPTITVNPTSALLCSGQSVSMTASGSSTYTWNPTTGLSSGSGATVIASPSSEITYTVTGTNANGCTNTATTSVKFSSLPFHVSSTDICNGVGFASLNNINPNSTYSWNTGQTGTTIKVTSPGTYIATVIDTNGCTSKDTAIVSNYANCSGFLQLVSDSVAGFLDTVHVTVKIWGGAAVFSSYAKLSYDNTLLKYVGSSVGNYLGSNLITSPPVITGNKIDFGMSKTNGQTGSYGDGVIYNFKFVILSLPLSIRFISTKPYYVATLFSLSSINVYDDVGNKPASFNALSMDSSYTYISNFVNVWPGDLNNDYKVNSVDLLPIGYFYNQTGPARPNGNLAWKAQPAPLWGYDKTNSNSSAYKTFADANGDGIIDLAEQAAIGFNLSRAHQRRSNDFVGYPELQATNDPPLWADIAENIIPQNQLPYNLKVPVKLGTSSQPVSNLYGIAFDLYFDPICINTAAIGLNFSNFFGALNTDYIRFVDSSEIKQGHISVSMTRFNTTPVYANGNEILNITFKVIQSCGTGWFKVVPQVLACNTQDGTLITISAQDDSVQVLGPLGLEETSTNSGFEINPNPNSGSFNIVMNENIEEGEILIYNVLGENVYKESLNGKRKEITVNAPAGVYLVQINDKKMILTKKVILK